MALTKEESGYILPVLTTDPKGLRCDNCYFFKRETCTLVKGKIDGAAVCNLWSKTNKLPSLDYESFDTLMKILETRKTTKQESGYVDGRFTRSVKPHHAGKGTRCGSCLSFIPSTPSGEGGCHSVEGNISPYACCNIWHESKGKTPHFISGDQTRKKLEMADIEDLVI